MKIGLLSTSRQLNYGGILQAFALKEMVQELQPDVVIETIRIDITHKSEELYGESWAILSRIWNPATIKRWVVRFFAPLAMGQHRLRRTRTLRFLKQYLAESKALYPEPSDLWKCTLYDLILVGSDQVWRYQSRIHTFCLLSGFKTTPPKRIGYAVSLGWNQLPENLVPHFRECISRFDAISIREPSSVETIRGLLDDTKPVHFCVDPTLLYGPQRWQAFLKANKTSSESPKSGDYAFIYWLHEPTRLEPIFKGLQAAGFKRIQVAFSWYTRIMGGSIPKQIAFYKRMSRLYGVEWRIELGPMEFLEALANASYVVANSFHALMFSILFERPVRCYVKVNPSKPDPMACRLLDFAERYELPEVVFEGLEGHCDFQPQKHPDFDAFWSRIQPDIDVSYQFLTSALQDCVVSSSPKDSAR